MTTAYQEVFDRARTISINRRKKVSQTQSRSGVVKTTSVGGQVWEFEVRLPDGPRFSDYRSIIQDMETLDRVSTGQISIPHHYIAGLRGDVGITGTVNVAATQGSTSLTVNSNTNATNFRLKKGDYIQLGSTGKVYSVTNDQTSATSVINVHRPVLDATANYNLVIGTNATWDVICVQWPNFTIFGYDQVSWSGPFIFVEAI